MSKLKNTKKGMAKKALSVSLVAAMLATSNVPVWAAEDLFSDGAAAVEAPAEAPVESAQGLDDTEMFDDASENASAANADALGNEDLDVSGVTLKVGDTDVKGQNVTLGSTLTVGGSIKKEDGKDLQNFDFGYRIKGEIAALVRGSVTNGSMNSMTQNIWNAPWINAVGKTVELYIYREDESAVIDNLVLGEFTVVAKEVSGTVELEFNGDSTLWKGSNGEYQIAYSGKSYAYSADKTEANTINVTKLLRNDNNEITDLSAYDITATPAITNAGEVMTIQATPKANSGLKGNFVSTVTVRKREGANKKASDHLTAEVNEKLTYEYTGNTIVIPNDKIIVKEIKDKYADAVLQGVVADAETFNNSANSGTDGTSVGEHLVKVALNVDNVQNFDISADSTLTTSTQLGHTVTITNRDLANVKVSLEYKGNALDYVPDNLGVRDLYKYLAFTAADGTKLVLDNAKDYDLTVTQNGTVVNSGNLKNQGTYSVKVSAKKGGNCVNSVDFEFTVGRAVSYVESGNSVSYYYSGSEYTPGKNDLGALKVYGKVTGTQALEVVATVDTNAYEIVGYKNNVNAGKAAAVVKITKGDFADRTFDVEFTISPLQITQDTVKVPELISIDKKFTTADEYKVPLIVTAKDPKGTIVKGLTEKDFTVSYKFVDGNNSETNGVAKNEIHDLIQATITSVNPNFVTYDGSSNVSSLALDAKTEIVAKALTNDMVKVEPSSYTYTGKAVKPDYYVIDGITVLYDEADYGKYGEYRFVRCEDNLNVGTAKIVVEGINDLYSGKASATFEITPANTKDVKVEVKDQFYTGRQVRPRMSDIKVTLNGNDVTSQFELTDGFGKNVDGKGTLTLKPVDTTKNFTGANVTAEFNIVKEIVKADLYVYEANGSKAEDYIVADETSKNAPTKSFDFDGTAKTFADALLKNITKVDGLDNDKPTKATAEDFEIKYADNISGKKSFMVDASGNHYNIAYVYAVGKDGSGYAGNDTITLADGSKITGVVAKKAFAIKNVQFVEKNVTVTNGVYAGGLPVKPQVLIQINGNTLVEGKDYELEVSGGFKENWYTESTNNKKLFSVTVNGKGGYEGSKVEDIAWGIDQKDLKDCDVKVVNGVAYVMNGYIPVPTTEYTVKDNEDKTYTVTANKDSKNYTGSKTVDSEGTKPSDKPGTPMISKVNVVGNKATVILSGDVEGASGYDYVISTDRDCITNKDYDKVNKNKVATQTTFQYVAQDVYYAYCHAWKRDENGKKVFGEWSNAYPFSVSAITPEQPGIQSVKVSGSTVTVTYTKCTNATGYDIVLGSAVKKVNDEMRPVEYGTLVKKITKGTTVTATFKNVKKGTYYAGLHAYNRTSEDGKKVFSPWSNTKKVTVK